MSKKSATAKEKKHLDKISSLGCLVPDCSNPANVHHIRSGQGTAMRASHYLTIPLCKEHHQGDFSIHNSKREFENIFGSELDLLAETISRL